MIDKTIPFFNTILRCDKYKSQQGKLPNGYAIIPYQKGFETDWARLEYAIGDFSSVEEAIQYFMMKYPKMERTTDILFLVNDKGLVLGSCIAWTDKRQGNDVNSLHWLIIDESYQRNGFGRAICRETMNRFYQRNHRPIYIHTQPWSWKAILLYVSLGFRLQKTDTFADYTNQYNDAMRVLKEILSSEQYQLLESMSDD